MEESIENRMKELYRKAVGKAGTVSVAAWQQSGMCGKSRPLFFYLLQRRIKERLSMYQPYSLVYAGKKKMCRRPW